jgi:hypothetical protein
MGITRAIPLLAFVVATMPACASLRVHSYADARVDVASCRRYSWDDAGPGATGDPRLDNNRFFRERMVAAVDRELSRKGFERVTGQSDLIVSLHARVAQKVNRLSTDATLTSCVEDDCPAVAFDEGTLLLDFIDARTERLAWRGWAEADFAGVIDDQDWMNETIDRIVAKILGRFPQRAG